jgi:integrase
MPKKAPNVKKVPRVRIAKPTGRPFQIRYTCPIGKREIRVSVGSRDIEEAERMKKEIEARFVLGLDPQPRQEKAFGPEMDWNDFREEYRGKHLRSVRQSTAEDAENRLDIAERLIHPETLGDLAKKSTLQDLKIRLLAGEQSVKKRPRSPFTVRGYLKSIVAALNWAYEQDWLSSRLKCPQVKTSKNPMKGRPISAKEFQQMLDVTAQVVGEEAADSWKYILRGLWESALRIEELMYVAWDKPRTIRPVWKDGRRPVLEFPASRQKNDTNEAIPILPGFEDLLLETPVLQRTGWVFNPLSLQLRLGRKVRHKRPNADWVGKVISRIGKKAGIVVEEGDEETDKAVKYASAHDLRRSCAENLHNANIPPLLICRIMRHSSWETTRKHYVSGDVQLAAETLKNLLRPDSPDAEKSSE